MSSGLRDRGAAPAGTVPPEIWAVARRLVDATVHDIRIAGSGANSAVYRVDCAEASYALKRYPARASDPRDRCGTEWHALGFLVRHGVDQVPCPLALDAEDRCTLMEWIEGTPVHRAGRRDLEDAADFVRAIFDLSFDREAAALPPASEACLSTRAITGQVDQRATGFIAHERIDGFLRTEFCPAYEAAVAAVSADRLGVVLPEGRQRLVPADFGFHNALRQADGRLRYVDFDYFGWDDPVKVVADFVLHPAMGLDDDQARLFVERLTPAIDDGDFLPRLRDHLPLFAARWALILLNAFRADRVDHDALQSGAMEARLREQLDKASAVLERGAALADIVRSL